MVARANAVLNERTRRLTGQQSADRSGIALTTLARYVARHRRANAGGVATTRLLPVWLTAKAEVAGLTVLLAGGHRLEVKRRFNAVTFWQLINALERRQ